MTELLFLWHWTWRMYHERKLARYEALVTVARVNRDWHEARAHQFAKKRP